MYRFKTSDMQIRLCFLHCRFVGLATISTCLGDKIDETCENLKINTTQQLNILLDSSPEKWIVGPAGSGKTCLLMEKVVRLAHQIILHSRPEKILVLCYHKPLSLMLNKVLGNELKDMLQGDDLSTVVDVMTFDKLLRDINGLFNEKDGENRVKDALKKLEEDTPCPLRHKYDHIFVDEGQDLYGAEWPSLLQVIRNDEEDDDDEDEDDENDNFDPRFFWVFYDSNQHLHLSKKEILPHSSSIKGSARLHEVLRNTKNVFVQFEKYFKPIESTSSICHQEVGLEIEWDRSIQSELSDSDTHGEQSVAKHVDYLRKRNVKNGDICVLVRDETARDTLVLNLSTAFKIECQNAEQLWTIANNNKVVVESIRRFKGLESKVVMLYNPPFHAERKTKELLYTAISRCFCYLIVISTQEGCEALRSDLGYSRAKRRHKEDHAGGSVLPAKRVKELEEDVGDGFMAPQNSSGEDFVSNEKSEFVHQ